MLAVSQFSWFSYKNRIFGIVSGLGWVGNVAEYLFKLFSAGRACRRFFFSRKIVIFNNFGCVIFLKNELTNGPNIKTFSGKVLSVRPIYGLWGRRYQSVRPIYGLFKGKYWSYDLKMTLVGRSRADFFFPNYEKNTKTQIFKKKLNNFQ